MKVVVYRKGKGLVLEELPEPKCNSDQVLIRVANTGFCGSDHSLIENEGTPDGIILGHEVSGTVIETGSDVDDVKVGSRVILRPTFCGVCPGCEAGRPQLCSNRRRSIGIGDLPGGFCEFITAYPQMLISIPDNVDSRNAALAEAYAVGLHGINVSGRNRESVLVIGAGAIGLALISCLKIAGYGPVAVSEPIEQKRSMAADFGADCLIDPLQEDLMAAAFTLTGGKGFRTVFECAGAVGLLGSAMNVAGPGGTVCQLSVGYEDVTINPAVMLFKELQLTAAYGNTHEENRQVLQWMSEGKIDGERIISDTITLDQLPEIYGSRIHPGKAVKVMIRVGEEF